jgi:hypothetical protein
MTGLGGIALGDNPNGIIAGSIRPSWTVVPAAVRRPRGVLLAASAVVLGAALYLLRVQNVITGWVLAGGLLVIILAVPQIAKAIIARDTPREGREVRDGLSVPLEWMGLDSPATAQDLMIIEQRLGLEDLDVVA